MPRTLAAVCVFCGSRGGRTPAYAERAAGLGRELAARGIELVYGGASVGLMGTVADAALEAGGRVTGVIPRHLEEREIAHPRLTDLRVVRSMHERKTVMAHLADAFVTLPGGLGTLEETFEVLTWAQLGLHAKPTGFLDVAGYFDGLRAFLDHAVGEGFLRPDHRALAVVDDDPRRLLDRLAS